MQIIQGIRDKGAAIVIVVIALSLIGFILMDAKQGSSRFFSSNSNIVGKINSKEVELTEFNKKVKQAEDQEEQRTGKRPTGSDAINLRDRVWNQIVAETVFYAEAEKLGIDFTAKELTDILKSNDQSNPLMQEQGMTDPATGRIDEAKLREALSTIKKAKGDQYDIINERIVEPQKLTSVSTKYIALLNAAAYYPSWMEAADKNDNKNFASISYTAIPYGMISDSTIKVSDEDVQKYVDKHKDLFKQEEGRMVSYVAFSQLPSVADSERVKGAVLTLKPGFSTETNVKAFLARNTSIIEFDSNYLPKSKITGTAVDSIIKLPEGAVYGPYVDKGGYVLAKKLGSKTLPDSVKARHILIGTVNPQTGQPILEDSVAKKTADSILAAINGGADFTMLALKYTTDQSSKLKGGDLGTFGYGAMVPEFNDYCFNKTAGSKAVVRTQFGYHVIEILSQKGSSPAYKIAYMAKEISASQATVDKANLEATKLAQEKDPKNFEAYIQKNGLKKVTQPTLIKENDGAIGQLQGSDVRTLIRWIFEAKKGDISDPFNVGDQYVVTIVDKVFKEGTQDVQTARPMAERAIKDEKKSEEILKKLGSNPTLETAAAAYGKEVMTAGADSSIIYSAKIINNIGAEPRLIGACFNKANQSKVSAPIVGKTGVYLIKVNGIGSKSDDTPEQAAQKKAQQTDELRNQSISSWFDGLKKQANIKDNRSKYF